MKKIKIPVEFDSYELGTLACSISECQRLHDKLMEHLNELVNQEHRAKKASHDIP